MFNRDLTVFRAYYGCHSIQICFKRLSFCTLLQLDNILVPSYWAKGNRDKNVRWLENNRSVYKRSFPNWVETRREYWCPQVYSYLMGLKWSILRQASRNGVLNRFTYIIILFGQIFSKAFGHGFDDIVLQHEREEIYLIRNVDQVCSCDL